MLGFGVLAVRGSGCGAWGLGVRVWGLGFRGLGVWGLAATSLVGITHITLGEAVRV